MTSKTRFTVAIGIDIDNAHIEGAEVGAKGVIDEVGDDDAPSVESVVLAGVIGGACQGVSKLIVRPEAPNAILGEPFELPLNDPYCSNLVVLCFKGDPTETIKDQTAHAPIHVKDDFWEALDTIQRLNNLGDAIYQVRDRAVEKGDGFKGDSWLHPDVVAYGDAMRVVQAGIELAEKRRKGEHLTLVPNTDDSGALVELKDGEAVSLHDEANAMAGDIVDDKRRDPE